MPMMLMPWEQGLQMVRGRIEFKVKESYISSFDIASLGSPVPCKDGKHSTHTCNLISCKFTIRNPTDVFSQELPPHLHVGFSNLLSSNPIEMHVPDSCHTVTTETSSPTSTAFNSTCPK